MKASPDSGWSCVVCFASFLSIILISGGAFNFGLLLPPLMEHFNSTRQATDSNNIEDWSLVSLETYPSIRFFKLLKLILFFDNKDNKEESMNSSWLRSHTREVLENS
ncbi:hypothetical protein P5673_027912 [Acropora cervicornis]|uniref:Uncharacterized protein n=1 Tax=Acropora cervicornis TaxID=6130 RepID=A0AAD9UVC3_ACRCE|nr:hypothetical protein P5673_027912 [Acropora cervicornis]